MENQKPISLVVSLTLPLAHSRSQVEGPAKKEGMPNSASPKVTATCLEVVLESHFDHSASLLVVGASGCLRVIVGAALIAGWRR